MFGLAFAKGVPYDYICYSCLGNLEKAGERNDEVVYCVVLYFCDSAGWMR